MFSERKRDKAANAAHGDQEIQFSSQSKTTVSGETTSAWLGKPKS
jgi:hypothetical protein